MQARVRAVPSIDPVRDTEAICQQLGMDRFAVDGCELRLPMEIPDCSLLINAFLVRTAAAQALLDASGLCAAPVLPGRSVLLLLGASYRDSPLGIYQEAAVLLSAWPRAEAGRSWLGGALQAAVMRVPYFVYRMPVDQEFTLHAGRFLWGYPKYLARIAVGFSSDGAHARLEEDGELVFAIRAPASGRSDVRLRERTGYNLTLRSGRLRRVAGTVSGHAPALRLGGAVPEIGSAHPLARELRSLGLPRRPFLSASLARASMRFSIPEVL